MNARAGFVPLLLAALAAPAAAGEAGGRRGPTEAALRLHELEAVHGRRRIAERSRLRGESGRAAGVGGHRGRPRAHRQRGGEGRAQLARGGRPAVPGGDRDRRRQEDGRRVARALRRRAGAPLRRSLRPLAPAQQRAGERRRVRGGGRERPRLGGDDRRSVASRHRDGGVDGLHREELTDGRDLELRRELRRQGQGLPGGLGQRCPRVRHPRAAAGRTTSTPTARWRSTSTATTGSTT